MKYGVALRLSLALSNRGLNYDKFFKDGDAERNTLTEFNSNNTKLLNLEETKETIAKLAYIHERLAEE